MFSRRREENNRRATQRPGLFALQGGAVQASPTRVARVAGGGRNPGRCGCPSATYACSEQNRRGNSGTHPRTAVRLYSDRIAGGHGLPNTGTPRRCSSGWRRGSWRLGLFSGCSGEARAGASQPPTAGHRATRAQTLFPDHLTRARSILSRYYAAIN
jgi:hypothetical protein